MFFNEVRYGAPRARTQWVIGLAALLLVALFARPAAAQTAQAAQAKSARTILVMGDSLSAAYGLASQQGWVALTADRVARSKPGWRVVNASISGETTAGGASRIVAELQRHRPAVVVIELGANDGLRGLPLAQTRINLEKMIKAAQASKAKVLLIGMRMPPNYGPDYTRGFEQNYSALSAQYKVALLPFLLEPIALDRTAYQDDNMHPVASAQPKLRDHVWKALEPLLR